jgi:hypothetical protein
VGKLHFHLLAKESIPFFQWGICKKMFASIVQEICLEREANTLCLSHATMM